MNTTYLMYPPPIFKCNCAVEDPRDHGIDCPISLYDKARRATMGKNPGDLTYDKCIQLQLEINNWASAYLEYNR